MASEQLPAMKTNPKFVFFTDFDGTITIQDSNDFLTDNFGFGKELRVKGNKDTLEGKGDFRDLFQDMMDSISMPFDECIRQLLANVPLDPGFKAFKDYAKANNIPIVVLSGGMKPILEALLEKLVGPDYKDMQIVANDVVARPGKSINEENGWDIKYHDDSPHGHDKSLTLRPYAALPAGQRPTMFYAGDGVSDLSAAKETDLLFAKEGKDLVTYCVRENVPFTTFKDWSSITSTVNEIVEGKITVADAAERGWEKYKSENPKA